MSAGKVLLGIGLGLDVLGTLFISLDAYRGQEQTVAIYNVLAFMFGFEAIDLRYRSGDTQAAKLATQAIKQAPADASGPDAELIAKLRKMSEIQEILSEAENIAGANNRDILRNKLTEVSNEFASRRHIIEAAIAAVFLGGMFELVGGVIL
jgi:hypothetical protein